MTHDVPEQHREFARRVAESALQDPRPTFDVLAAETGIPADALVHHALVSWVSAGSEALLSLDPRVLGELYDARDRDDWRAVAGIIDWLRSGDD